MLLLIAFQIIAAPDCNFQTAFEKGAQDIELGSYGANIDRFCAYETAEPRENFSKNYELGRQYGPRLKKAEITRTPTDQIELDLLLREARLALSTKETAEKISNTSKNNPQDIQNFSKKIEILKPVDQKLSQKNSETPDQK